MITTTIDSLRLTLGNESWIRDNEDAIKRLLPDVWTHAENLAGTGILRIAYGFKVLGIDWRTPDDFGKVMVYLEHLGILLRQNGYQVRANPRSIFA